MLRDGSSSLDIKILSPVFKILNADVFQGPQNGLLDIRTVLEKSGFDDGYNYGT